MATNIIMPALEMAQESGTLVNWIKHEGDQVAKGDPIMEIETDKVTVEIGAPESGILAGFLAKAGDVIQVGKTIGWLLKPGEAVPAAPLNEIATGRTTSTIINNEPKAVQEVIPAAVQTPAPASFEASPIARKMAEENGIDLSQIGVKGKRIEKADVQAYLESLSQKAEKPTAVASQFAGRIPLASPKARRLAEEKGYDLGAIPGTGPEGAVIVSDVESFKVKGSASASFETSSTVWKVMAERMSHSWSTVPHFYLVREVDASSLVEWRTRVSPIVEKYAGVKPTFTDLIVKLIAEALKEHPRLNASWAEGGVQWNKEYNIGIAAAVDEGLIVPVIRNADTASVGEIAQQRVDLIARAKTKKLRPADVSGGTFTLSNLGMYNVDAFDAIVNTPQAAILSIGRITDRVVPRSGQIVIRPMFVMTLSLDHRVVDGARAAQFLDALAELIDDPWKLLA